MLSFPVETVWATIINTYILIVFIWPLQRKQLVSVPLKQAAKGSCWSILVSGVCTVINLSVLLILKGEHGIECLLCCSIDVLVNTLVLAIITDARGEEYTFPMLFNSGTKTLGMTDKELLPSVNVALTPLSTPMDESDKRIHQERAAR